MNEDVPIFRDGSTAPSLSLFIERDGVAEPILVSETVIAHIYRSDVGLAPIVRNCVTVDGPNGVVQLDWQAGDLVNTSKRDVDYRIECFISPRGEWSERETVIRVRPAGS